jgi:hypothetical protein
MAQIQARRIARREARLSHAYSMRPTLPIMPGLSGKRQSLVPGITAAVARANESRYHQIPG